ncbi:MAG TPA: caspase family protein, partial [Bacteroidota bacterium]|nr:caspase family protein [Bacteroidota bacterium]
GIATDNKGIQMVFINSNPCVLSEPTPEELRGRQLENESMKFEQTVSLGTGLNTFEIVALDVSGRISTTILRINGGPKSTTTLPKTWAVVVGVSEFKDPTLNLHYAANDARLFYDFLRGVKGGELPENQIELLMNADATRANILRKVEEKTDKAGSDDRVILYFATHGAPAPKGNEAYLFSTDTDPGNLVGTGVAWNDIDKQLALSAAKDVIILTDACHEAAGNAIALRSAQGLETHNLLEKIAMTKKGIVYFSASTANEFSREGEKWGGHGVFTKYLVAGLDGAADRNRDGIVTITELEDYVRANVLDETNGLQRPGIKGDYIDGLIMSITR